MPEVYGVTFGDKHSYLDWGIYWNGKSNTPPTPLKSLIQVPFKNGVLDATRALTDKIIYGSRTMTLDFMVGDNLRTWPELYSEIIGSIHGRSMQITLDTDPDYYWEAYTVEVGAPTEEEGLGKFTVTCECFPYKMKKTLTKKTITVNGAGKTLVCQNSRMEVNPTFVTTANVQVVWVNKYGTTVTIAMSAGTHTYDNIEFSQGNNLLTFNKLSSNANVTVLYREGEL